MRPVRPVAVTAASACRPRRRPARRRRRTAAAGSAAPKTAVPATNVSAPACGRLADGVLVDPAVDLDAQLQVAGVDVPAGRAHLVQQLRQELLPAEAGLDRHDQQQVEVRAAAPGTARPGCPGRSPARPGPRPRAGPGPAPTGSLGRLGVEGHVVRRRPRRTGSPSAPARRSSGGSRTGASVAARSVCTSGSPMVRLGTKWLSMMSTCSQSAACSTEPGRVDRRSRPRAGWARRGATVRSPRQCTKDCHARVRMHTQAVDASEDRQHHPVRANLQGDVSAI